MYRKAEIKDIDAIQNILVTSWRHTYKDVYEDAYIEAVIKEYYNRRKIKLDIMRTSDNWTGYYVLEVNDKIVGCIGGGIDDGEAHIYVLYMDVDEKYKGYGKRLVSRFTATQKELGITKQYVSVAKDNMMGIPFYKSIGFIEDTSKLSDDLSFMMVRDI